MTRPAALQQRLRLVGAEDQSARADWALNRRTRQEVIGETRRAVRNPGLDPADPRWVLAARAYSQLQGSTLTPDRRQRVMRTARHLGVRPFEANVICAIVQDQARRGGSLGKAAPTLALLRKPGNAAGNHGSWLRWIAAIAAALTANALLIHWLLSAS